MRGLMPEQATRLAQTRGEDAGGAPHDGAEVVGALNPR